MAVRAFDLSDSPATRLRVLEAAPRRRRELRRQRRHWAYVGVVAMIVPFAAALVTLGVTR
jgi:hypothetical protein